MQNDVGTDVRLEACPFCGDMPELVGPDAHTNIFVMCFGCGARGVVVNAGHGGELSEAIAAWNRRVPTSSVAGEDLHIVFGGPPGPVSGRFVEVETPDGRSIKAGEWATRPDGLWELRLASHHSKPQSGPVSVGAVSPRDPLTILAGIEQFGLAPDLEAPPSVTDAEVEAAMRIMTAPAGRPFEEKLRAALAAAARVRAGGAR